MDTDEHKKKIEKPVFVYDPPEYPDEHPTQRESEAFLRFCERMATTPDSKAKPSRLPFRR